MATETALVPSICQQEEDDDVSKEEESHEPSSCCETEGEDSSQSELYEFFDGNSVSSSNFGTNSKTSLYSSSSQFLHLHKCSCHDKGVNHTFSRNQIREIDNENSILMRKIQANGKRPNQYKSEPFMSNSLTSNAINRRKNQDRIDVENRILLKKIHSVKSTVVCKK